MGSIVADLTTETGMEVLATDEARSCYDARRLKSKRCFVIVGYLVVPPYFFLPLTVFLSHSFLLCVEATWLFDMTNPHSRNLQHDCC
jgi:hypothetical protein